MKKAKLTILSLGVLFLATGCGSNISDEAVSQEQLNSSVAIIKASNSSSSVPYLDYLEKIESKFNDNYLKAGDASSAVAVGGYPMYVDGKQIETLIPVSGKPYSSTDAAQVFLGNNSVSYEFDNVKTGRYYLQLEYCVPETFAASALIGVGINGEKLFTEADTIVLPLEYEDNVSYNEDGTKNFNEYQTKYNDQMSPNVKRYVHDEHGLWTKQMLYDTTYVTSDPLIFEVSPSSDGKAYVTIENKGSEYFYIGKLNLIPVEKPTTYLDYIASHSNSSRPDTAEPYKLNAIEYAYKNSNEMTLTNEQVPSVTPYDHEKKLLNVTSGWDQAGQAMTWEFSVEQAGLYPITLHYYNDLDNFPLYRRIEVNGEVPFAEVESYEFPTTGSGYKNVTIGGTENPYLFYFKQGVNTITLTSTIDPLMEVYNNLMLVYDHINDFSIKIRKITGSSVDQYRTYKITQYYHDTVKWLKSYKMIIQDSYVKLKRFVGNDESAATLSYFQRMNELVDEFIEEPDDLPLNLTKFSSGDSCLAKLIADTATSLQSSTMILDMIYVTNDVESLPKENASWTSSFYSSLVSLGQTFGKNSKYKTVIDKDALNIWSARPQSYNDILQTFADKMFTPQTGIKVNIRQMPSEDNLIYAYAANTVPDLVLGINSGRAFEFALRGDAAYPLSDFDETWKYTNNNPWGFTPYYWDVVDNMPHGQLMSMLYEDKFYSLPESTSAQLMFSRDDIMSVMGTQGTALPIPNTWDEVVGILYRLQSLGMNFYYPTSASGSLKPLGSTSQFILQNNGTIMDETGFKSNFRDPATYKALKLLTDLYTIYALPTEVGSFYNHFRYGTYPLGIGDVGMYLQLKYVAPELLGKWSVHQIPGTVQQPNEDGTYKDLNHDGVGDEVSRWYVSNGSAAMIFNNSNRIDDAWLFLQWWMTKDIQERFTESLQSTFGPSVVWFSANLDAAESLPIDADVRETVLQQVRWIVDLQQIPGQYMLERGLSDIWNSVVFGKSSSGESTGKITIGEAIDLEKVLVDREVQRKMEEFGYFDTNTGTVTKEYKIRSIDWVESCINNHKSNSDGGNSSTSVCPI